MPGRVFAIALTLFLAACGGGGSSSPGSIPSAGQAPNSAFTLAGVLPPATGTIGAGYIVCDTAANIAAGNNCNGYANFSNGAFVFTAIAATSAGVPIAQQLSNGGALGYSNGSYQVAESPSDGAAMISISGGPWVMPGSILAGGAGAYGNRFAVTCLKRGVAHLQLQLVSASGTVTLPLATSTFPANETAVQCSASGSVIIG